MQLTDVMVPVHEIEPVYTMGIYVPVEPEIKFEPKYTYEELVIVANTIEGEAGGLSREEMRLVAWCICNRVDTGLWGDTITAVVTPNQFHGYSSSGRTNREDVVDVAKDVLDEWSAGKPADILEPYTSSSKYLYFYGDGSHNWFREEF